MSVPDPDIQHESWPQSLTPFASFVANCFPEMGITVKHARKFFPNHEPVRSQGRYALVGCSTISLWGDLETATIAALHLNLHGCGHPRCSHDHDIADLKGRR